MKSRVVVVLICLVAALSVVTGIVMLTSLTTPDPVASQPAPSWDMADVPVQVPADVPVEVTHEVLSDTEYISRAVASTSYLAAMAMAMTEDGPEAAATAIREDQSRLDPLMLRSRAIESLFTDMEAQGEVPKGLLKVHADVRSLATGSTEFFELMKSGDYRAAVSAAKPLARLVKRIYAGMDSYSKKHRGKRWNKVASYELTKAYVEVIDAEAERLGSNP